MLGMGWVMKKKIFSIFITLKRFIIVWLVGLWFNVPVNNFSVMLGQSPLPGYLPVLWGA